MGKTPLGTDTNALGYQQDLGRKIIHDFIEIY